MRARIARHGPTAGRHGFTMVEVLVSMLLMAVILPVAMKGVSLALHTAAMARDRSLAVSLAQTQMADLITGGSVGSSSMQGDFPDNPGYTWTATLTQWIGTTVEQLEVTVLWTSNTRQHSVTLDTLIYTGNADGSATTGSGAGGGTAVP